jgi:hypothetical protein
MARPLRLVFSVVGAYAAGCAAIPRAAENVRVDPAPRIEVPASESRPAAEEPLLSRVEFMAGEWIDADPSQGVVIEERWTPVLGGTMLGSTRTVVNGRLAFFEYLRLEERGNGVVYVSQPKGGDPTPFALVAGGRDLAVFENLGPEFPKRIIYRRDGDTLFATIEGPHDGKIVSSEWRYRRK